MTAKELAARMNKAYPYVNNIINGGKGASVNTLMEIAEALNVPMATLFADYEAPVEEKNILICPNCGKKIFLEPKLKLQ